MIDFELQRKRSELYRNIRAFFESRGYLEVFTPCLSEYLIPEPTIKTFKTEFISEFSGRKELFLLPSPEYYMKRMISEGSGNIYQIARAYRNAEEKSNIHSVEFDILEYYTMDYSDSDTLYLTIEMIKDSRVSDRKWLRAEPVIMTMREALLKYCKVDLNEAQDISALRKEADRLGLSIYENESWEDTFNRIFLTFVEPNLPKERMVFITEYPKQIECLAKNYSGRPYKMRWEMYINSVEIANTYKEETDPEAMGKYFEKEQMSLEKERRESKDEISKADPEFPSLKMRECSGGAIGLDRLLMAEMGLESISPLLSFPISDILN